jgi:hypothetical protein
MPAKKEIIIAGFDCPVCSGQVHGHGFMWKCPTCGFTMGRHYKADPNGYRWTPNYAYYYIERVNYNRKKDGLKPILLSTCGNLSLKIRNNELYKTINNIIKTFLEHPENDIATAQSEILHIDVEGFKTETPDKIKINIYLPEERDTYKNWNY